MDPSTVISVRTRNLVTAFLALAFLSLYIHTVVTTRSWIHRPFPGFVVLGNNLVPTVGMPGWPGVSAGVKFGDVVTAVDGRRMASGDEVYDYVATLPLGQPVKYTLTRDGEQVIKTVTVTEFSSRDWAMLVPVLMLFGGFFYGTGVVVFFLRSESPAARAFLINGVLVGTALTSVPAYILSHQWTMALQLIAMPLVGPSFLVLARYFPETRARRRPYLAVSLAAAAAVSAGYLYFFGRVEIFANFDLAMLALITVTCYTGMYLTGSSFYSSRDPVTRQKAKIVLFGFSLTFMGSVSFVIGTLILKNMALFWLLPAALMALPLSIAYAILKHNLFDVDLFIRRSVSYIVVSAAGLTVLVGSISLFSLVFQGLIGPSSPAVVVVTTVIIMLGSRPLYRRVERLIDRKFFREKYEYQTTLRRAAGVLASIVELSPLLSQVLATVMDAIKIERGLIMLRDEDAGEWVTAAAQGYQTLPAPPAADHPLLGYLETERRAVQINEVMELREFAREREAMIEPAARLGLVLLAPISYERRLIGVLGLGPKRSGAWYSSEDIDLLSTLMVQTGVSIANARQVEKLKQMVALETSYRELQRLDEMKDSLLHMVSHDLRTPMTGILGYAYMLHEGVETLDAKSQREYLSVVIKEGERLTRLINDLLDLQRFEAGRMELAMEEIDVAALVDDAARVFTITMDNQGLRFERELPAGPMRVTGDRDRLEQVIANLLSNAIKYTEAGGAVTVRAERTAGSGGGGEIKVTVADTGRGIAREFQDGVFDKFQQAQRRAAGPGEGSGLGLALVKEIVQYHRGRVGFESEPGRGSSFYFYLPEAAEEGKDEEGADC